MILILEDYFILAIDSIEKLNEVQKKQEASRKKQVRFLKFIIKMLTHNINLLKEVVGESSVQISRLVTMAASSIQTFSTFLDSDVIKQMKEIWEKFSKPLQSGLKISAADGKRWNPWSQ